jgi:rubrerythrin
MDCIVYDTNIPLKMGYYEGLIQVDIKDLEIDRDRFDAVWRRVMPEPAEYGVRQKAVKQTTSDDACRLREFMDNEAQDARIYCMLASMCSGSPRQALLRISSDERCHLKKLRARYFILTGEMYKPAEACPLIYSVPDALRKKHQGEKEGAAAFRSAAEMTSDRELADTYLAHADDEARHSKMIGCIIENII